MGGADSSWGRIPEQQRARFGKQVGLEGHSTGISPAGPGMSRSPLGWCLRIEAKRDQEQEQQGKWTQLLFAAPFPWLCRCPSEQLENGKEFHVCFAKLTVAAVTEVGPDDVLLGEAEDPEASPSHGGVQDNSGVCHDLGAFVEPSPGGEQGRD